MTKYRLKFKGIAEIEAVSYWDAINKLFRETYDNSKIIKSMGVKPEK